MFDSRKTYVGIDVSKGMGGCGGEALGRKLAVHSG